MSDNAPPRPKKARPANPAAQAPKAKKVPMPAKAKLPRKPKGD